MYRDTKVEKQNSCSQSKVKKQDMVIEMFNLICVCHVQNYETITNP